MKLFHSLSACLLASVALAAPVVDLASRDQQIINTFQVTGPNIQLESVDKIHLWQHTFANSYGAPKVAQYTPPNQDFDRVRLSYNSSVTTTQYDRLIQVFVGDTEVWRSSTAEPVGSPLVQFGFEKDVSEYLALFKEPQTITFVLGNVVQDGLQGQFDTNFFIEFLKSGDGPHPGTQIGGALTWNYGTGGDYFRPADVVHGLSKGNGDSYSFPDDTAKTSIQLPRNTTRAVVEIHASGNSNEEFWYTNMFNELSGQDGDGNGGPSRIVEVWIGGRLAGVAFPYPVVYTGGISPYFWTPIVSPQAFDGPSYRVDVTPFLPWLWQGIEIELKLTAQYTDKPQNAQQNWFVTGALLAWTELGLQGSGNVYVADNTPTYTPAWNKLSNSDMVQVSHVNRVVKVMSQLQFSSPRGNLNAQVTWNQNGISSNIQYYTSSSQAVLQSTKGSDSLEVVLNGNTQTVWNASYFYPVVLNTIQQGKVANSDIVTGYDRVKTGVAYERTVLNATSQMGGDSSWGTTYQSYWRSLAGAYDVPSNYDATYYSEEAQADHGNLQYRNPSSSGSATSFKDGSVLDTINHYTDLVFASGNNQDPWEFATALSNVIKALGYSPAEIPSSSNDKSFAIQSGGDSDSNAGPYRIVFSGGNGLHQH